MYSKEAAAQIKKEFWTTYGRYMAPVLSAEGTTQNWINYSTGIKHVFFRTQFERKYAYAGIHIIHPDESLRSLLFLQFTRLKNILHEALQEEWVWEEHAIDGFGKPYSSIYIELENVSIYRKDDWPAVISFLKSRIIALDTFWNEVKDSFDVFR